jgi:heme/copper-type cytochrome/quinol oxidase subunit 2
MESLISNLGLLVLVLTPISAIFILSFVIGPAFAQEPSSQSQQYINRRVEIWALFYRGMVAAFIVGAVVQGSIIYVAWRFRESHPKNVIPTEPTEDKFR